MIWDVIDIAFRLVCILGACWCSYCLGLNDGRADEGKERGNG